MNQEALNEAIRVLNERQIPFVRLSPYHFRMGVIDFWPTSGKFYNRKTGLKGNGLKDLLLHLDNRPTRPTKSHVRSEGYWAKFFGPKPKQSWKPIPRGQYLKKK